MPAAIHVNTNALVADEVEWKVPACGQKLALDFVQQVGLLTAMDDDTLDLIIRLGTRVGMIMEDASPVALMMTGLPEPQLQTAIAGLTKASAEISALVAAIESLAGESCLD